jgi:hypothetical protein
MKITDGNWELMDHDFKTGRTVWAYFDGQATHYRTDYPVDNILKDNQTARQEMAGSNWGGGKRVASIPLNTYYAELAEAENNGDQKFISKWLNDGDNAAFRTFEGKV